MKHKAFLKKFCPFGLKGDQIFKEYDLIYVKGDYMFTGGREVLTEEVLIVKRTGQQIFRDL